MEALLGITVGGAVGTLFSIGGIDSLQPRKIAGSSIPLPGFVGRVLTGAVAAWLSWELDGPLSAKLPSTQESAPLSADSDSAWLESRKLPGQDKWASPFPNTCRQSPENRRVVITVASR